MFVIDRISLQYLISKINFAMQEWIFVAKIVKSKKKKIDMYCTTTNLNFQFLYHYQCRILIFNFYNLFINYIYLSLILTILKVLQEHIWSQSNFFLLAWGGSNRISWSSSTTPSRNFEEEEDIFSNYFRSSCSVRKIYRNNQ